MNDARPVDLDVLHADFGHVDVHMLQYSGAIWYPMVYDMPARAKEAFGTQKRQRQMDRCRQYIAQVGATWVVPSAGPPCFLDPELRDLNDDHGDPANIFPDQVVFLDQMRTHGHDGGAADDPRLDRGFHWLTTEFADPPDARRRGARHLHHRQGRLHRGVRRSGWRRCWPPRRPAGRPPTASRCWNRCAPSSSRSCCQSDQICDGIGYPVELRMGAETVVLDFPKRAVREPIPDEKFRYGFEIAPELVRTVLRDDEPDWVNTIFLSTRFKAWRVGGYNEYLYTFFKCLTDERIAYADGWFAEAHDDSASITLDGWEIQRRCPHLKADLSKFGVVEGTTLTCNLHGWQWNLNNGRCLTSKGHELRSCERL